MKTTASAVQHDLDTRACLVLMKRIGDHFGAQIATQAISEGWHTHEIANAVNAVIRDIKSHLLAGGAKPADIAVALDQIDLAIVRAGRNMAMLLVDAGDGGNA